MYAYEQFNLTSQTTTTPTVVSTDPGKILAGGSLTVLGGSTGSLLNADSTIVAGGPLNIATGVLNNQSATGIQTTAQTGNDAIYKFQYHGGFSDSYSFDYKGGGTYNPPPTSTSVNLNTVTAVQGAAPAAGSVPNPVSVAPSTVTAAAVAAPQAISTHVPTAPRVQPAQTVGAIAANAPPVLQQVTVPARSGGAATVISTSPPVLSLPGTQFFQVQSAPNAPYLVETDPAFTNQQNFLGSSYYLQQLGLDPAHWQKRYGDGFAEQQLVQNQILALTGRNLLASYSGTQAEYQALMNAGVAFAKQYDIAPGVTLSAQQMALVTTDMVLLTTQTVTLPGGGTQAVLVPQVYLAHPQGQDLTQGGALIAGGTVTLTTAQDLTNSGTLSGNTVQASAGHDLVNSGTIAGQQVLLSASNDLKNLSGLIAGTTDTSALSLLAGRDLVLQTQTLAASNASGSTTSLGRVAAVQGGSVTLQAARDLIAQGAQITSGDDLTAVAGRNLTVTAATTTYAFDTGGSPTFGAGNALQASSDTQHGSTLTAAGNATLVAQSGDLSMTASSVSAGHDTALSGQNVTIASGINSASRELQATWGKSAIHTTTSTQSQAAASVSAGHNLTVQATGNGQPGTGNLTVTGAALTAQSGAATLQAANNLTVNTLALGSNAATHSHSESSGTFGSRSSTTQADSSATDNAASSVSGSAVMLSAGNDLTVTGSTLTGTGAGATGAQVNLTAGSTLSINAAANTQTASSHSQSSGGLFGGQGTSQADLAQTAAQASRITGGAIALQSGADLTLQAAQISGQRLSAQAGVINGQQVNPSAQL
ncbi:MAG: hemagglutinin repeat-containing protein, partial [Betaproteobacteria bacterium]|nr:hemagglutinin repeat-containing protein [Betaproteobacteria bacterium]